MSSLSASRRGERFLANTTSSRELVALEIISAEVASAPGFDDAFMADPWFALASQAEQRTLRRVVDRGRLAGAYFVAYEWIPGTTLDVVKGALHARRQAMDAAMAVHIAIEICRGLNAAHTFADSAGQRRQVLHLRLRPEDVFLSIHGGVKLGGFGAPLERTVPSTALAFAAPEILRGAPVDTRADIYSVGSILNLMLSVEDPVDYGRSLAPTLAPIIADLASIVRRAMDTDPLSRWASTTALRTALQAWAKSARFDLSNQTRALPDLVRSVSPEAAEGARAPTSHWTQEDKTAVDAIDSTALRASLEEPKVAFAPQVVSVPPPRNGSFAPPIAPQVAPRNGSVTPAVAPSQVGTRQAPVRSASVSYSAEPSSAAKPLPQTSSAAGLEPRTARARGASGFAPEHAGSTALDPVDPALLRSTQTPEILSAHPPGWAPIPDVPQWMLPDGPTPSSPAPAFDHAPIDVDPFPPSALSGSLDPHDTGPFSVATPFAAPVERSAAPSTTMSEAAERGPNGTGRPPPIADPMTPAFGVVVPPEARPPKTPGKWKGDTQEGVVESDALRATMNAENAKEAGWSELLGNEVVGEKLELATPRRAKEERAKEDIKPLPPRPVSELKPPRARPPEPDGESRTGVIILAVVVVGAFFLIGLMLLGKF